MASQTPDPAATLATLDEPPGTDGLATYDPSGEALPDTNASEAPGQAEENRALVGIPARYVPLALLGRGGIGEVWRVHDTHLDRVLAMKLLRSSVLQKASLRARFVEEARATAQLQHPGIVPVHELGQTSDGRFWFTMMEVRGQTLAEILAAYHASGETEAEGSWTLRRLMDLFGRVCEAVGYAHSRGVVHRDLKPHNIMVGAHGEVQVLDWGVARILARAESAEPELGLPQRGDVDQTRHGVVVGTPAYMAPEQARGAVEEVSPASDVYALGAVLYEVLSGAAPYAGPNPMSVLEQVRTGPPLSIDTVWRQRVVERGERGLLEDDSLDGGLVALCERSMARDVADRFQDAAELAARVVAWLDGAQRRARARLILTRADALLEEMETARQEAERWEHRAGALQSTVSSWQSAEQKQALWAAEDTALQHRQAVKALDLERESLLLASLTHAPELEEAHFALAARFRAEHTAAELRGADTKPSEARLRHHLRAVHKDHPERLDHEAWLTGDGALTLHSDPPGAEVVLRVYVPKGRRLVLGPPRSLGYTPVEAEVLAQGSYLCVLRRRGHAPVRYPIHIGRQEHWDGVPPGGSEPRRVVLPREDALGPDEAFVPAGWFWCGGDPGANRSLPRRRVWVDDFVCRHTPVRNRDYLAFLNRLAASGRFDEALQYVPRERAATSGERGAAIYGWGNERFFLRPDADGDLWDPDWPVMMIDWFSARAFARFEAERTGLGWRLPTEVEWEKAARGVDRRIYPWGNHFDASWTCVLSSHRDGALPRRVGTTEGDVSPYGVRDMAGNIQDWCLNLAGDDSAGVDAHGRAHMPSVADLADAEARRSARGGCWYFGDQYARLASRFTVAPDYTSDCYGVRLVRSL